MLLAVKDYKAFIVGEVVVEDVKPFISHVFSIIENLRHPW
jgi:hypothetical protein